MDSQEADKNYKRLAVGQPVGLRHAGLVISVDKIVRGVNDEPIELVVQCKRTTDTAKPKAFVHWVATPVLCEVRLYERLFKHKNPEDPTEVPGGFVTDCNKVRVSGCSYPNRGLETPVP